MKLLLRYLTVLGIAVFVAVMIITYQRNKSKTTDQTVDRYTSPLINKNLYAVVLNKSITDATDRIQSGNAMLYSLKIDYIDIITKQKSDFLMNYHFEDKIAIGDTLLKNSGDRLLILHKKDGSSIILPTQ